MSAVGDEADVFDGSVVLAIDVAGVDLVFLTAQHFVADVGGLDIAGDALGRDLIDMGPFLLIAGSR